MIVEYKLKCRLNWFKCPKKTQNNLFNQTETSIEEIQTTYKKLQDIFCPKLWFNNNQNSFCANNKGLIHIEYFENISKKIIYKNAYSLLSFISV